MAFMIFDIRPGAELEVLKALENDEAVRDIYVIAGAVSYTHLTLPTIYSV